MFIVLIPLLANAETQNSSLVTTELGSLKNVTVTITEAGNSAEIYRCASLKQSIEASISYGLTYGKQRMYALSKDNKTVTENGEVVGLVDIESSDSNVRIERKRYGFYEGDRKLVGKTQVTYALKLGQHEGVQTFRFFNLSGKNVCEIRVTQVFRTEIK